MTFGRAPARAREEATIETVVNRNYTPRMADIPSVCPYCGQPLTNKTAIQTVHESEAAFEKRLHQAARAEALRLAAPEIEKALKAEAQKRRADAEKIGALQQQIRTEQQRGKQREIELRAQLAKDAEKRAAQKIGSQLRSLKQTLQKTIDEKQGLERRLEHLTASERGSFSEEDLTRSLKQAFPDDTVARRGRGGDVLHEVVYRAGAEQVKAGLIVYECKDTLNWNKGFIAQAREAAELHRTPYAIVVSKAFPPKQKDLFVSDAGVVVVHPDRVIDLVHVVRRMVMEVHRAGLSAQGQAKKTLLLHKYLTSNEFRQCFDAVVDVGQRMRDLLQKERRDHQLTWGRREDAYNELTDKMAGIDQRLRDIIERSTAPEAAKVVRLVLLCYKYRCLLGLPTR
jgi:hypothetical protein